MHLAAPKLVAISGEPVSNAVVRRNSLKRWGVLGTELAGMLGLKNGFYAYESALLVRPLQNAHAPLGLLEWNTPRLWKGDFHDDLDDALFFAEDVFGCQFCIRSKEICTFEPETGLFTPMSPSLEAWATDLMADYRVRTGYPLAHAWQLSNEPLPKGVRLLPKVPFVLGGKYELENLYPLDDVTGMSFRASIANQVRDAPDGGYVVITTNPEPVE